MKYLVLIFAFYASQTLAQAADAAAASPTEEKRVHYEDPDYMCDTGVPHMDDRATACELSWRPSREGQTCACSTGMGGATKLRKNIKRIPLPYSFQYKKNRS